MRWQGYRKKSKKLARSWWQQTDYFHTRKGWTCIQSPIRLIFFLYVRESWLSRHPNPFQRFSLREWRLEHETGVGTLFSNYVGKLGVRPISQNCRTSWTTAVRLIFRWFEYFDTSITTELILLRNTFSSSFSLYPLKSTTIGRRTELICYMAVRLNR